MLVDKRFFTNAIDSSWFLGLKKDGPSFVGKKSKQMEGKVVVSESKEMA